MKSVHNKHRHISDIVSLSLLPLSGFATDIYIPSLPSMSTSLGASMAQVQLSIMIFMVSAGVSQLFVGSLLDSFGRYNLSNIAILAFSMASFTIAWYPDLRILYLMRGVQGVSVAFIVVAKRAYFMDTYSGDRLKHFTSLFTVVWSAAPIIAPFFGGYLQQSFGWQSNFYFLGIFALSLLVLTLRYGGETGKTFPPFEVKPIARIYASMLTTKDFILALMILGLSFSMVLLFGMASPFIIEHVWHLSSVVTGYCSLLSGTALLGGNIFAKSTITRPLGRKIPVALGLQLLSVIVMIIISTHASSVYVMMPFVILQHVLVAFVFNNLYSYSLGRFSRNAGIAAGLAGGVFYITSSLVSYGAASLLHVRDQKVLVFGYLVLTLSVIVMYALFRYRDSFGINRYNHKLVRTTNSVIKS
ncbi:MAG TPA: MFS transporter [Chitinophagaceae bacterium]|nr:MFS transporter [Chitinophagaceae bacterium]